MLKELKQKVYEANLLLVKYQLVILSFGNVSGIDRKRGLVAIKPSGVAYQKLKPEQIVILDLDGRIVEGELKPSMDTPTHLELYRAWKELGGICHTHSPYATAFAQAEKPIPCLGTTHADHFSGEIPVTRVLSRREVRANYETNTGKVILECFAQKKPMELPAVLVSRHGPFSWGKTPLEAVNNAFLLEEIARMAFLTLRIKPRCYSIPKYLLDAHYFRKHGPKAFYGQK